MDVEGCEGVDADGFEEFDDDVCAYGLAVEEPPVLPASSEVGYDEGDPLHAEFRRGSHEEYLYEDLVLGR